MIYKRISASILISLSSILLVFHQVQSASMIPRKMNNNIKMKSMKPQFNSTMQESIIFFEDFEGGSTLMKTKDLTSEQYWHTDSFNAYSGQSWWCGIPEIPGYLDWWYQVLVSPSIDLSSVEPPVKLSFMHFYSTEGEANPDPNFDFWDGGNVRVSVDGGNTLSTIYPSFGSYDTDTLMGFVAHDREVLPGYSGEFGDWVYAEFDLSEYQGQTLKFYFTFVSDWCLNTTTISNGEDYFHLLGWFLDDIKVQDAHSSIFFDDGGDSISISMSPISKSSGDFWEITSSEFYSPNHSFHCDDRPNLRDALITPSIGIPLFEDHFIYIRYNSKLNFEDWDPTTGADYCSFEISEDGVVWVDCPIEGSAFIGSALTWTISEFDLRNFSGQTIQFRWVVCTDNYDATDRMGFFIDDIMVYAVSKSVIVENTNDIGAGSLRNAIQTANVAEGPNTIVFSIPDTDPGFNPVRGVWTIKPQSPLPQLTDTTTTIDGTTQTENHGDRNPYGPEIEIDGSSLGEGNCAFDILSSKNVIKGLIINQFSWYGIIIQSEEATDNRIIGNYIGTDETGEDSLGNWMGIAIGGGAKDNIIGGTDPEDRNIVSGISHSSGIQIIDEGTNNNKVIGNYIGVGASGETSLGNYLRGIVIHYGAKGNIIGGSNPEERNVISGNHRAGIYIADSDSNVVLGNYIGTDISGTVAIGNGHGSFWTNPEDGRLYYNGGVVIDNGSGNVIGDSTSGGQNLISGNYYHGIYITKIGSANNTIRGNLIGTDISGSSPLGNELAGVKIDTTAHDNIVSHDNTISFNGEDGVYIEGQLTQGNIVDGNAITDNTRDGIRVENVTDGSTELTDNTIKRNLVGIHVIGGVGLPTIEGNVIEDNTEAGILIEGNEILFGKAKDENKETLKNNIITLNENGIHIRSQPFSTLNVFHNNIYGNTGYGIYNESPGVTVVANDNWWGDGTGPYDEISNPQGQGNAIFGNIVCNDWLSDILILSISSEGDVGGVAGTDVIIDFEIYNLSAVEYTFDFTVTDSLGWIFEPVEFSFSIGAMANSNITVTVTIPQGTEVGTENKVTLSGVAAQDPSVSGSDFSIIRIQEGIRGDVNKDGSVNILDALRTINIILGVGNPPSDYENWASDCNDDGTVNILDVLGIVNEILGISECEP